MLKPPNSHQPATWNIYDGQATWATDVLELDKYVTWLAASRKWQMPVSIGTPLDSTNAPTGTPVPFDVWINPFTEHIEFNLLCTGKGTVTLTLSSDGFNSEVIIDADDAGAHAIANVIAIKTAPPKDSSNVVADAVDRGLNMTSASTWTQLDASIAVTDAGGGKTLKVWALRVVALQPDGNTDLPA